MEKDLEDVPIEKHGDYTDEIVPAKSNLPPVIPFKRTDEVLDFTKDEDLLKFVRPSSWVSVDLGGKPFLRFNWVTSLLASIILLGFVVSAAASHEKTLAQFGTWQSWITQNFTWFYIGTQDVWCIFLIWLAISRFGNLKLGRDDEEPEYSYGAWFTMLFACGIGVGIYFWGVSEPMNYYRAGYGNRLFKTPFDNDDQRAQQALTITLFHWGLHGWVVYIIMAILLGFVSYRWNMPMTIRSVFFPLLGDTVFGPIGDVVDGISVACTTFGVCTSLGFGAQSVNSGLNRLSEGSIPADSPQVQIITIWVITAIATTSVLTGLNYGIKILSQVTFAIGVFLCLVVLFLDNTWFILNAFVQSLGHYLQYLIQLGFVTDAFEQLNYEFSPDANLLWGSGPDKLYNPVTEATGMAMADPSEYYNSHPKKWMDWWTIFYWGWWIAWSPFVGMFIARISRGRTIRQVILGAMFVPVIYSLFWLVLFGSLGIKMQRTVELALNVPPDFTLGSIDCAAMGYEDGAPISDAAVALADLGYYSIACRNHGDRVYDVLSPYGSQMTTLLHLLVVVGVILYFVTSSDSGSYVDDLLSAGGREETPPIQKVYWCLVEGACASVLLSAGGSDSLKALQAVSICSGFPYTFVICFMCTSLYWACLHESQDPVMMASTCFKVGLWDWTENKRSPELQSLFPSIEKRFMHFLTSCVCPPLQMKIVMETIEDGKSSQQMNLVGMTISFYLWPIFLIANLAMPNAYTIGWTFYMFFVFHLAVIRAELRAKYKIYGMFINDFFVCMMMYPFAISQMAFEAAVHEKKKA